jgi:uncharacterized integral membrane protein
VPGLARPELTARLDPGVEPDTSPGDEHQRLTVCAVPLLGYGLTVSHKDFASFAEEPTDQAGAEPAEEREHASRRTRGSDPLRGSRTSGFWAAVLVLALLLLLLAVFILQNTQKVEVSFFGWDGRAPLAATLLIGAVAGALMVASAGALRILQLRRRVKRERRA